MIYSFGEADMVLIVDTEQLDIAKEFSGLLQDELLDLMNIYSIGNPRADGIRYKIKGLFDALDKISIEQKPEEPIKPIIKPEPVVKDNFVPIPIKIETKKQKKKP